MASFNPPSVYAKKSARPAGVASAEPFLGAELAERFDAARKCVLCKIAGDDRPGFACAGPLGEVECGSPIPLYTLTLDAHLASADGRDGVTKYVAP